MVESITVEDGYFAADFSPDQYDYEVFLNTINYEPDIFVKLTNDRFEYTITGADHIIADDTGNLVTISCLLYTSLADKHSFFTLSEKS